MTNDLTPVVTLKGDQAFTNSRDVAKFFARLHKNVLQGIQNLECSADFNRLNFQPVDYRDAKGECRQSYDMTKDGFTFLAMGYTGSLAAEFKEKYIAAFNELERHRAIAMPTLPDFSNPVLAARAWADEFEQKQALQIENQKLVPLAKIGERAVAHDHPLNRFVRALPDHSPRSFMGV